MTEFLKNCTRNQLFDYILFLEKRKISPHKENLDYFLAQDKKGNLSKKLEQGFSETIIQVEI